LPLLREPLPWDAAFLAGQAFRVYRLGKGGKTSPMPDFLLVRMPWCAVCAC
jgi:hypothetical protein